MKEKDLAVVLRLSFIFFQRFSLAPVVSVKNLPAGAVAARRQRRSAPTPASARVHVRA
jgi:hypothetical protein